MHLTEFTDQVKEIVGHEHYDAYGHILSSITAAYHDRCLHTLKMGFDIPDTAHYIAKAKDLPTINYRRYIKFLASKKENYIVL